VDTVFFEVFAFCLGFFDIGCSYFDSFRTISGRVFCLEWCVSFRLLDFVQLMQREEKKRIWLLL